MIVERVIVCVSERGRGWKRERQVRKWGIIGEEDREGGGERKIGDTE